MLTSVAAPEVAATVEPTARSRTAAPPMAHLYAQQGLPVFLLLPRSKAQRERCEKQRKKFTEERAS
jgi:hypothetical protein